MRRSGARSALLIGALILAGCAVTENVTDTGQRIADQAGFGGVFRQVVVANTAGGLVLQSVGDIDPDQEYFIGRAVAADILAHPDRALSRRQALQGYVSDVGQAIALGAPSVELPYQGFRFAVLESRTVNAVAAPSGYVFVTTGAVDAARNEDELAALLAHEIAHVQLRHGLAAIRQSNLIEAGKLLAKETVGTGPAQFTQVFGASVADVVGTAVTNGYSRAQESEADRLAVQFLAEAGYSPRALTDILARVDFDGGGFRSDHPSAADRVATLTPLVASRGESPGVALRAARFGKVVRGG